MVEALVILAAAFFSSLIFNFIFYNKIRQISRNLKELIKENDSQQTSPQKTTGDIYFKIDKNFEITYINESGADNLGHNAADLIGKSVFGLLIEDKKAYRETLASVLNKVCRHHTTINTQIVLIKSNGQKQLMLCRERPLLNEILECEGLSFLCKDISEANAMKEKLSDFENRDIFTNGLNEQALMERFEHDFNLAKRYNKEFSCIVVELRDVYDFISRGIDFETADRLLKTVNDVCFANLTPNANIGRVDKTKIVMLLNNTNNEKAEAIALKIWKEIIPQIQKLGIDEANAGMTVTTFCSRRDYNDTFDGMWIRLRRHIKTSLKTRQYGVSSVDAVPRDKRNFRVIKN